MKKNPNTRIIGSLEKMMNDSDMPTGVSVLRAAVNTINELQQQIDQLHDEIKTIHRDYGCEIRDPAGTIWNHAHNLKIALCDAIRRPMGVVPDSAENLITSDDLAKAEERRIAGSE